MNKLSRSSWSELQHQYQQYVQEWLEYEAIRYRLNIDAVKANINRSDVENSFLLRFNREIRNARVKVILIKAEMLRRKQLIGVFG